MNHIRPFVFISVIDLKAVALIDLAENIKQALFRQYRFQINALLELVIHRARDHAVDKVQKRLAAQNLRGGSEQVVIELQEHDLHALRLQFAQIIVRHAVKRVRAVIIPCRPVPELVEHVRVVRIRSVGAVENERRVEAVKIRRIAGGKLFAVVGNVIELMVQQILRRLADFRAHARRAVAKRLHNAFFRTFSCAQVLLPERLRQAVGVFLQQRRKILLRRLPYLLRVRGRIVARIERAVGILRVVHRTGKLRHLCAYGNELQINLRQPLVVNLVLRRAERVLRNQLRLLIGQVQTLRGAFGVIASEIFNLPRGKFLVKHPRVIPRGNLAERPVVQIHRVIVCLHLIVRARAARFVGRVAVALDFQKRPRRVDPDKHPLGFYARAVKRLPAFCLRRPCERLRVRCKFIKGNLSEHHLVKGKRFARQRREIAVSRQRLNCFFPCRKIGFARLKLFLRRRLALLDRRHRQAAAQPQKKAQHQHQRQHSCSDLHGISLHRPPSCLSFQALVLYAIFRALSI